MNKQEKEYIISRYNDPDLTAEEKVQIQTWRREDRDVEEMLRDYQELDRGLERLAGPMELKGVNFDKFAAGVRDLLPARRRSAARSVWMRHWHKIVPLAAAALIVLAFTVLVGLQFSQQKQTSSVLVIHPVRELSAQAGNIVEIGGPRAAKGDFQIRSNIEVSEPTRLSQAEMQKLFPSVLPENGGVVWSFGNAAGETSSSVKASESEMLFIF